MWFSTDGPRPNSQSGPGKQIDISEAEAIVEAHQAIFVGCEAPTINVERPSDSLKNVVLEVVSSTEASSFLPQAGFHVVVGLRPAAAKNALDSLRTD